MKKIFSILILISIACSSSAVYANDIIGDAVVTDVVQQESETENAEDADQSEMYTENKSEQEDIQDQDNNIEIIEPDEFEASSIEMPGEMNNGESLNTETPVNEDVVSGFGNIEPEDCETISDEEKSVFLEHWDQGTENDSEYGTEDMTLNGGGWLSCGTMTSARSYMSSVAIGNNIYTFGGTESGSVVDKVEMYDTSTESWSSKEEMPSGRYKHTALALQDKVYICGGYNSWGTAVSSIAIYDVDSDSWQNNINTPDNNTNYSAGIYDNELYIFAGKEDGEITKKVYKYNFQTGDWSQIASMPEYAVDSIALSTNRGFYVISNLNIYEYDVQYDLWTVIDTIPREIYDFAVVNRGDASTNELYITGGREEKNSGIAIANTKYRYDTDSQASVQNWKAEWYNDLRMIRGLACHNMVVANGVVYVFGGQVTYGQDQKLMFKRNVDDVKDDYPDDKVNDWTTYIYGSINAGDDIDKFAFTPQTDGYYEIVHYNPIHSNNIKYTYNITVKDSSGNLLVNGLYTNLFGAIYMEAGETYYIDVFDIQESHRGNYMYQMRRVYDDAPDNLDNADEINTEDDIDRSFIGKDDADCFKFTINSDGLYDITVVNEEPDIYTQYTFNEAVIYDANKKIIYEFDTYTTSTYNFHLNAGTYYIMLKPMEFYFDTGSSEYTLNIHMTSKMSRLYNNRIRHGMESMDGKVYALTGLNNNFNLVDNIEVYDPETRMWMIETGDTSNIKKDSAVIFADNKIYVAGGYNNGLYYNDIKSYDPETKAWRNEGQLNTARGRAGAVSDGRYIYVAGGRNANKYIDTIEVFDTATATISKTITMPESLIEPQLFLNDDILYIVGGTGYKGYSDKIYAYEFEKWVQKTSMPYASEYMRGKGYNDDFICAAVNRTGNIDLIKYTSSTDEWSIIRKDYINDLIYFGFDLFDDYIYITGGYSYSENKVVDTVYSYDFLTDIYNQEQDAFVRTVGYEYEQTDQSMLINDPPEIVGVNAKILDEDKGIYELCLGDEDFVCDPRSTPFFFWSSQEGMFSGASDDYRRVIFYADPGTGDRQVRVTVGIGDGRGYVDKKAFLLEGNSETE